MSNFTGVALDYDQLSSASLGTYPSLVCWVRATSAGVAMRRLRTMGGRPVPVTWGTVPVYT